MRSTRGAVLTLAVAATAIAPALIPDLYGVQGVAYAAEQAAQTHQGKGTVHGVDPVRGTVSLSHGPIESLGWPAMRMSFRVQDQAMLQAVKPGMQVSFEFAKGDAGYVITRMDPVR